MPSKEDQIRAEIEAIRLFYALGGTSNPHAIALAAEGRCNPFKLRRRVKGHESAEAALAARQLVRPVGRPSTIPPGIGNAVGRLTIESWQCNMTMHIKDVRHALYVACRDAGVVFKVKPHKLYHCGESRRAADPKPSPIYAEQARSPGLQHDAALV